MQVVRAIGGARRCTDVDGQADHVHRRHAAGAHAHRSCRPYAQQPVDLDRLEQNWRWCDATAAARQQKMGVRCIAAGIFDTGKPGGGAVHLGARRTLAGRWIKALVDTAASISKRWIYEPRLPPASMVWVWPRKPCGHRTVLPQRKKKSPLPGLFLLLPTACGAQRPAFLNSSAHCGTAA